MESSLREIEQREKMKKEKRKMRTNIFQKKLPLNATELSN